MGKMIFVCECQSAFHNLGKIQMKTISFFSIEPSIFRITKQSFTSSMEVQKAVNLYHISHINILPKTVQIFEGIE